MAEIKLINISKLLRSKDRVFAIENLNLTIPDGKTTVILGPSGCGKSTLLRIISGLDVQDSGNVKYGERIMDDIHPKERRLGMVFEDYALYPHYTSKKNILSYFIFKKKSPELDKEAEERLKKTSELLEVDIEYLLDKNPSKLSAGEKQRVALGRCITRDPVLFLLDEPFANLDAKLRRKYRIELKKLISQFKMTTVYVTHDQQEASLLADMIAIMNDGKIEQTGEYKEIYSDPANTFVAGFVTMYPDAPAINLIDGINISENFADISIGIRPEDIEISVTEKDNYINSRITQIIKNPLTNKLIFKFLIGEDEVFGLADMNENLSVGQEIWAYFKKQFEFDKKSGQRKK